MRGWTAGLFLLLAAIGGLSFVAARAALPFIPPVPLAALRFDIVAVHVLGYAIRTTSRWRPRTWGDWRVVFLGGTLFVALHHPLLFAGKQYVSNAVAGVVISLDPVLAAAFAWLLLDDAILDHFGFLGLVMGLLGVGIIANPTINGIAVSTLLGVLYVFLSAAAFALEAVLTERYRTTLPVQSLQAWMMVVGTPLLHLAELELPGASFEAIEWTIPAVLGLAYLSVVAGAFGYLLCFALLVRIGAVEINIIGYALPIFAALGGWSFLDERITPDDHQLPRDPPRIPPLQTTRDRHRTRPLNTYRRTDSCTVASSIEPRSLRTRTIRIGPLLANSWSSTLYSGFSVISGRPLSRSTQLRCSMQCIWWNHQASARGRGPGDGSN